MPFTNVFRIVGKAIRSATKRPLQRFNIYKRSEKFIGEEAKHFFPAPRAIGPVSKIGPTQWPHLEGANLGFKSVGERRREAIESRNRKLLEAPSGDRTKSFSEIKQDDDMVIEQAQNLPVIKTVQQIGSTVKSDRPLPKLTSLDLRDMTQIWAVDEVPPGRLDLNKLQELMVNVLADKEYWSPKVISDTYNIKEEYAANLITHIRQIRIVISPRMAKLLDYTNRENEFYQATKDKIYIVDKSMRSKLDRSADETFLPEDEIDDKIRELVDAGKPAKRPEIGQFNRPKPLVLAPKNAPLKKLPAPD